MCCMYCCIAVYGYRSSVRIWLIISCSCLYICVKVALTDIREAEIRIDLMILPVEEAYVMLNKYQMTFNDGNAERVDTISYSWKLLKQQVSVSFYYKSEHGSTS